MVPFSLILYGMLSLCVYGDKILTGSWSLCKGEDATECPNGKYGNITREILPATFPVGKNFSIIIVGHIFESISNPSIELHLVDGTLIDTIVGVEGCGVHKYIFPMDDGVLYYQGPTPSCPIQIGPLNITLTASVSGIKCIFRIKKETVLCSVTS